MVWNQVRWTQAHQIASLMGVEREALPAEGMEPLAHYTAIRARGDRAEAVSFLGHALPRFEALAWAARVLEEGAATRQLPSHDRRALDHVLRWLGDPTDTARRSAREAAAEAGSRSAERMLATGVFYSGGSISGVGMPPIPPAPELAGRFAALAVTMAAVRAEDRDAMLDRALDLGEKVAEHGMAALSPA